MTGEVPGWDDLAVQAILMGGTHVGMKGAGSAFSKLGDVWVKTGKLPGEVARDIAERPSILTEMFDVTPVKKAAEAKFLQDHQLEFHQLKNMEIHRETLEIIQDHLCLMENIII